jgi:flavin reductase (DIM6/NTAB) family NADH-FMN oxidoreductase RutF
LETIQAFDSGDHKIFIGKILKARYEPDHEPLVYLRGKYRKVHVED